MDSQYDEQFVVYLRDNGPRSGGTPAEERALVHCASYEEAQWVRRECAGPRRSCIIRYVGPAGGGD